MPYKDLPILSNISLCIRYCGLEARYLGGVDRIGGEGALKLIGTRWDLRVIVELTLGRL